MDLTQFAIAALLPLTICQRRNGLAAGLTAFLVVLCGLSMWANFAIAQRGHITSSGIAIARAEQLISLQAERARLINEYQPLAGNGDAEALKRQMQVLQIDCRWDRTEQCRDATLTASREFCAEHAALFAQVAAANRAQQLQERISQLSSQIRSYTTPETAVAGRDPFAVAAEQIGVETELLRTVVLASFVLALELCGIVCCAVASDRSLHLPMQLNNAAGDSNTPATVSQQTEASKRSAPRRRWRTNCVGRAKNTAQSLSRSNVVPITQNDGVSQTSTAPHQGTAATARLPTCGDPVIGFVTEQLVSSQENVVSANELFGAFENWCDRQGIEPVTQTKLGRQMRALGYSKSRRGPMGNTVYLDVQLAS